MTEHSIEQEMVERRKVRNRTSGAGAQLLGEVDNRQDIVDTDESLKYYRRKGLGNFEGFEYTKMYQFGYDPIVREDDTSLIPNQFAKEKSRVIFGRDMTTGAKVDNLPDDPTMYGSPARIAAGGALDAAKGSISLARDAQDAMGLYLPQEMKTLATLATEYTPEWLDKSAGWAEDIARDIAQFAGGYAGAFKSLGKMGLNSTIVKNVTASIASGQTFDPEEGNLGTLLNEFNMLPDMAQFMDAKLTTEQEGRMQGRLALAMEEVGFGVGGAAIMGAKNMMGAIKRRYKMYGNELLKQGTIKYGEATSAISHPTRGIGADEVVDEQNATKALDMIASGFQISGGDNKAYMEMAKASGIDENLAKKAWNNAAKEKLGHIASFVGTGPATPMNRQVGAINFGAEDAIRDSQPYAVSDLERHFEKQLSRGNIQSAEYNETIKPAIDRLKKNGIKTIKGDQLKQMAAAEQPTFKTLERDNTTGRFEHETSDPTHAIDVRESERVGSSQPNLARPTNLTDAMKNSTQVEGSYKEHIFVSRNPATEGPNGFLNMGHYSVPFVKGFARTTRTEPKFGTKSPKSVVIQEMQSDQANVARKHGEWTDDQITEKFDTQLKSEYEKAAKDFVDNRGYVDQDDIRMDASNDALDTILKEFDVYILDDDYASGVIQLDFEAGRITLDEFTSSIAGIMRSKLATPSVFNKDKAWVRQVMRPVVEEARKTGSTRITLATGQSVKTRWGEGADKNYSGAYPKIMKQYFLDLGVPAKNIHMPKSATESFYVDLPPDLLEQGSRLPLYSAAGAAPLIIEGMENKNGN